MRNNNTYLCTIRNVEILREIGSTFVRIKSSCVQISPAHNFHILSVNLVGEWLIAVIIQHSNNALDIRR